MQRNFVHIINLSEMNHILISLIIVDFLKQSNAFSVILAGKGIFYGVLDLNCEHEHILFVRSGSWQKF